MLFILFNDAVKFWIQNTSIIMSRILYRRSNAKLDFFLLQFIYMHIIYIAVWLRIYVCVCMCMLFIFICAFVCLGGIINNITDNLFVFYPLRILICSQNRNNKTPIITGYYRYDNISIIKILSQ